MSEHVGLDRDLPAEAVVPERAHVHGRRRPVRDQLRNREAGRGGVHDAVAGEASEFCTACYTGKYPLDFEGMFPDAKEAERQLDLWEESLKPTP